MAAALAAIDRRYEGSNDIRKLVGAGLRRVSAACQGGNFRSNARTDCLGVLTMTTIREVQKRLQGRPKVDCANGIIALN